MMRDDWVICEIKAVFNVITGNTPSKKISEYYNGEIPFIKPPELWNKTIYDAKEFLTQKGSKWSRLAPPDSTLVTCIGNLGRVGLNKKTIAFNQQINAIIPNGLIMPSFIFFQAQSPFFLKQLNEKASATTVPIINKGNFEKINIKISPLPEQRAIVSKIEQLFSELDNGIASLKLAQEQLKVYRQAVLKKAFEGELTREWREQQTDLPTADELLEQIKDERQRHYQKQIADWESAVKEWEENGKVGKKPGKPKKVKELELLEQTELEKIPISWSLVKIESILLLNKKSLITGPFGTLLNKSEHKKVGIRVLGIENIGEGIFKMPNKIFVSESKSKELSSFKVVAGDIIISRSGTVGEVCVVPEFIRDAIISTNLIKVSLNLKIISPSYFVYLFMGGIVREQVRKLCAGSTREFLNQNILKTIKFPLPTQIEQTQIVQEIESRLSVCDKLEETIKSNLKKSEALRQSILKKAFEGKLLSDKELDVCREEPDWEPASKLLERIKAEKEDG